MCQKPPARRFVINGKTPCDDQHFHPAFPDTWPLPDTPHHPHRSEPPGAARHFAPAPGTRRRREGQAR